MSTPLPRPRARRNTVINLSSSSSESSESSQAIEERLFHSDSSPRRKKSIPRSTDATPESTSMRSASYGMFSGLGTGMGIGMRSSSAMPSSNTMRSTPGSASASATASPSSSMKRMRITSVGVSQRNEDKRREDGKKANRKNVRKKVESPLFEPESGYSDKSEDEDADMDMDVEMQSPTIDAGARKKRRLVRSHAFRLTDHAGSTHSANQCNDKNDYEDDPDGGLTYPPQNKQPIKYNDTNALDPLARIYAAHPLPGDSSLVYEYRTVLEQIDQQLTLQDINLNTLAHQDIHSVSMTAKLNSLPGLTAERDKGITETLTAAIARDMNQPFSSPEAVSAIIATRQAEAEQAKQELGREMAGLKTQWGKESERIEETKMELRNRAAEVEGKMEELKKRKTEIEERGDMAMVFGLCRELANGHRWGEMLGQESKEE